MTVLVGLLGWPVSHSASPAMFRAAFEVTGLDAVYLPFAVQPDNLLPALDGLRALGAKGVNVTIPHKRAVYQQMNSLTDEARMVGAVNCVGMDKIDGFVGHNTDVAGWWAGLQPMLTDGMSQVTVLGAGGATRAVLAAFACYRNNVQVHVAARDEARAQVLIEAFAPYLNVQTCAWSARHQAIESSHIVVNTTSVGMWPNVADSPVDVADVFCKGQLVQDVVYRPAITKFLAQARAQGATVVDGAPMLVHQGARAFEYWFGQPAPIDAMYRAVTTHLGSDT